MFQLVESLRIENGMLHHIRLHNHRLNNARNQLFRLNDPVDLGKIIKLPASIGNERHKCRVTTTDGEHFSVEITPYHQREIKSLKLVHVADIDYTYKTDQRELLNQAFALRGDCDDIIIVKNGQLTDAWAANIILSDGEKWYTPSTPLLKGIQREFLLSEGIIEEKKIHYSTLHNYKKIKLINALIDFDRAPEIDRSSIITTEH